MRLNLGCGDRYVAGWHNVDLPGHTNRVDEQVDLTKRLPWKTSSIQRVYAGHVLEHLTMFQARLLLKRLLPCMVRGGQIMVVGPDVELAKHLQAQGYALEVPLEHLRFGADRWAGDVHRWECTQAKMVQLLTDAGWWDIRPMTIQAVPASWPVAVRAPQWQTAVQAEVF